jgi:hypothetical protein
MPFKKILLEGDAAILSDTAPSSVNHAVASAGVATDAARRDHKHDLDEGVVGTLKAVDGSAMSLGSDNAVPHLDHVHALGPLQANFDFNKKQAVSMVLENLATDPGSPVAGQIYFKTGDSHPYIYTA